MTSPDGGSKGSSPLRVGGLALIGVGAVAAVLGAVGLGTGSAPPAPVAAPSLSTAAAPSSEAAAPAPQSAAPESPAPESPAPGSPAPVPSAAGAAPPVLPTPAATAPPVLTTAPAAPAGGAAGAGAGAGARAGAGAEAQNAPRAHVRVYNNSTVSGLAAGAAEDFRGAGWTVDEVANYPTGTIPTSTVYYRPGTSEQASAERIGSEFGLRTAPRFAGLNQASPGLIVIVTNDYQKR